MMQTDITPPKPFRVVIVGAGIVGLSLSHALQLAKIDHVVLEKYDRVKSVKGAALIIWPNAERIFDQFGFLPKILSTITPVTTEYRRWPDGTINGNRSTMNRFHELFGVPPVLFDRQSCVAHLYDNLPDQSTVKLNKRVERIEHTETGIRVVLTDGTVEEGDIVIGADGVHSTVRSQMWDYASKFEPNTVPESDKSVLFSEYDAMFGVSKMKGEPEDYGLAAAETNIVFGQGVTKLFFQQQGQQMWALVFKDKYNQPPKRFKATNENMEEVARRFADVALNENIKFSDLWESRTRVGLLTIEEGVLSQWHAGRIVLVGDSAHKMTADLGIGANIAIEDAVALCNILHRELKADRNRHPTKSEITSIFVEYQKERWDRAKAFTDLSGKATRMNSYDTLFGRVFATYIAPYLYEAHITKLATAWAKAPKLDYVPVQTIDENAPGWLLAKEEEKASSTPWLVYAGVSALVTGLAVSRYGFPKL
ncbi:FAD/NAD(P)-binding domain-containing protein [Macroventuria anomochaeta]|uniref:FAD/NAD(P)-binding domain-containing protein n=1 Tax=Macroventuria anomochaeta TaxID=301207 RepID=A0ACB6SFD1_9PLEO|nr:FAD/NAD(P)-binding domain-containing protein [Macroventuria anomochaeta]KAF2632749.1 FAD/NAD(P)-binding domain-containing protein [Macroventuria anomochaeta]